VFKTTRFSSQTRHSLLKPETQKPSSVLILLLFLLCLVLLTGCEKSSFVRRPVALAHSDASSRSLQSTPALVLAAPNATPTPTPFQPLPPTSAALPTSTPLPTEPSAPPTPTLEPFFPPENIISPEGIDQPVGQMNILLLGSDRRPWDTIFRTDTIILATLNSKKGTINLTSFPRDLYINIPGWGSQRINTAFQHGGFDLLADTFETNFGVRPDHYVLINFSSFKRVIDSLGGLDVDVAEPVADYKDIYWTSVPAGTVHMDADMVLWYVRTRKTSNDFARGRRQQEVLNALFKKFLSMNAVRKVPEFYEIYKDSVETSLTFPDIVRLLPLAARLTDSSRLNHYYIGGGQVWDWISPEGGMVLLPRQDEIMKVLRQALNEE
jgi:LCP family protein required for cell wall assembly